MNKHAACLVLVEYIRGERTLRAAEENELLAAVSAIAGLDAPANASAATPGQIIRIQHDSMGEFYGFLSFLARDCASLCMDSAEDRAELARLVTDNYKITPRKP